MCTVLGDTQQEGSVAKSRRSAARRSYNRFYPSKSPYPSSIGTSRRLEFSRRALQDVARLRKEYQRILQAAEFARRARIVAMASIPFMSGEKRRQLVQARAPGRLVSPALRRAVLAAPARAAAMLAARQRRLRMMFQPGSKGFKRMVELYDPNHTPQQRAELEDCVKRKLRREVMFAKGVGGSAHVSRERNWKESSNVRC